MYCLLCDDSPADLRALRGSLTRYFAADGVSLDVEEFASGEALLSFVGRTERSVDLILLDVFMAGVSGVETARRLRREGYNGCLIFTTTSRDFAADGFDLEADDYLVKPYSYERLARALERVQARWAKERRTLAFTSRYAETNVYLSDLLYIESVPHGCLVHTAREALPTRWTLQRFEEALSGTDCAYRLRKSHLVNLNAVEHFDDDSLYMKNGDRLAIPVRDKARVKQRLLEYYWAHT